MLRVLEHGYPIQGVLTEFPTFGVDHVEDVAIIEKILRADADQEALLDRIIKEKNISREHSESDLKVKFLPKI